VAIAEGQIRHRKEPFVSSQLRAVRRDAMHATGGTAPDMSVLTHPEIVGKGEGRSSKEIRHGTIFDQYNKQMERLDESTKHQLDALRRSLNLELKDKAEHHG
jgi:hypothetical protein